MNASAWDFACIACSAGWAVCLVCMIALDSSISHKTALVLALVAALGAGACTAEGRVCDVAERLGESQ